MLKNAFLVPILCAGLLVPAPAMPADIINPHEGKHCLSCHVREPVREGGEITDYSFLAKEIDPTCMICHGPGCCSIGSKDHTHASGIKHWDVKLYGAPRKLPLKDGYITCVTCHFWRRDLNPEPEDYKLLRIVKITKRGIDWTELCHDCHREY